MDNNENTNFILKKRLNTFKSGRGSIRKVPDKLIIDIVRCWEQWPGSAKSLYQSLGLKKQQLAIIIKKGKKLISDGKEKLGPFTPIEIKTKKNIQHAPIVLQIDRNQVIKFFNVEQLIKFLNLYEKPKKEDSL